MWQTRVFPSNKPVGRQQALYLAQALRCMLAEAHAAADSDAVAAAMSADLGVLTRMATARDANPSLQALHGVAISRRQLVALAQTAPIIKEMKVWDVALAEMARQSSVVCHERGLLLERARTRTMLGVAFLHRLIGALLSLLNKSETVAVEVVSRVEELTKEAVAAATRPVGDDEADVASKTAQDLLRDHQSDVVRSKREMDGLKSQLSKLVDECNGLEKS